MNLIVCLIAGGIVGLLAGLWSRVDGQRVILEYVFVCLVGAFIGYLASPYFSSEPIEQNVVSLASVVVSFVAAVVFLIGATALRRSTSFPKVD